MAPPVTAGAPAEPITHRNWSDEWVTVRCGACGREDDWPHPETGCACGTVLRIPVRAVESAAPAAGGPAEGSGGPAGAWPEAGADRSDTGAGTRAGTGTGAGTGAGAGPGAAGPGASGPSGPTGPSGPRDPRHSYGPGGTTGPAGASDPIASFASDGSFPPPEDASPGTEHPSSVDSGSAWFGAGPGAAGTGSDATRTGPGTAGPGAPGAVPGPGSVPEAPGAVPGPAAHRHPGHPPRPGAPRTFAERYPAHIPLPPTAPRPAPVRGDFRPLTIRTARDAVAAAAGYLRWLGFRDVVQPEERPASGVDLRAPGLVAQVDPSTRPTGLRAVECLWLNGLTASSVSVFFSLAGYTPEARSRAAEIGLPLFVLDLTGTPQPVNSAADDLVSGAA
ncbi:hypothetical protein [Streptomyces sp. NBC_00691]|uniref:hypothetical protein n=1 Tax=Streptomyces sp. NBC_00691 TaxID=2903671 RepID=UPI002E324C99|nr:hypothetical protein [Streptomyces sp. NBC_00691]